MTETPAPQTPPEGAAAPQLRTYHVAYEYTADECADPIAAARELADLLATPGVPARGMYRVTDAATGEETRVDLDAPELGGSGYFG